MKSRILLLITLFALPFYTRADIFDDITAFVRTGNSKQLALYFNTTVDLTVLNQEDVYSKAQAELILKDFFLKNVPKEFNIKHQGTSKEGARYVIGNYTSVQNVNFRTYFLLRLINGKYIIEELRFEQDLHFEK